jgi:deoxyhypusine synthase
VDAIINAHQRAKPVIWAMGAHVIKCGLSPLVIELIKRNVITAVALNGAGAIHDVEIALIGETSEDVGAGLADGSFGMAEETGRFINEAVAEGAAGEMGMGEILGRKLIEVKAPHCDYSILAHAGQLGTPVTVHVAIGTDIVHMHPTAQGGPIGITTFRDFRLLAAVVADLGGGGVYLNIGSAVLLPEVFLKALTLARNLGHDVSGFTTVNLDMQQHYRPLQNVVGRPTALGGKGYAITGQHELMLPLLVQAIIERLGDDE